MPRYALLLWEDVPDAESTSQAEAMAELTRYGELVAQLEADGVEVDGAVFMPPDTGHSVRVVDGAPVTGPVVVGAQDLGGYLAVTCDEAMALDIAARIPVATHGRVEVRLLFEPPPGMFA